MIEVNASVYKKLKDICSNYEQLKERYEKDRKKRIVGIVLNNRPYFIAKIVS